MHQSIFWWFHQCHSIGVSLIVFYEQLYRKLLQSQGLLCRLVCCIITPILTKNYQQSINTGQIPEDWKNANIVPIFKKGDRSKPVGCHQELAFA
jgi:hypothetical protein